MQQEFSGAKNIRYLLGGVEDAERMKTALCGVDVCIMAAANKRIDSCAYNIESTIKTNVMGTLNVMHACIYNNVPKNIYISTDKVVNCQTSYGAQKMLGERIFIDGGNNYGNRNTLFSAVRYGNVLGSTKSLKTFIKQEAEKNGFVSLTKKDATRFWMTVNQAVDIVLFCEDHMNGGEVFIPKRIKAANLETFAEAFAPGFPIKEVGFQTYEKYHEELITEFEQGHTADFGDYYAVLPLHAKNEMLGWNRSFPDFKTIEKFKFTSDAVEQMSVDELRYFAE
jgi:UDP-N-acetylglucosamine 4,6-dehydratase